MHPAYSVIFFTAASGAGYGLLIWLSALGALGLVPVTPALGIMGFGLSLALITSGLLSSTLHLGHPERAWRALSQWRSSWLSREGVAAVFTYVPALALAGAWIVAGQAAWGWAALAAWLTVAGALATVVCTGMIYASLPTIRAWAQPLTMPVYVVLALATGAVLLCLMLAAHGGLERGHVWLAAGLLALGWVMKAAYWSVIDAAPRTITTGTATGLGRFGTVRQVEAPHTQANFVMREMGFQVARRHAETLRQVAVALAFVVPLALLIAGFLLGGVWMLLAALVAVFAVAAGILAERWLFFAEAEHVAMVFYGKKAA